VPREGAKQIFTHPVDLGGFLGGPLRFLLFNRAILVIQNAMTPDKLEEIFQLQDQLNKRIGMNAEALTEEERVKWVLNYTRAMTQEIAELVDSVPWKWWAKYQQFDVQNARVEVVDLFHFLISIAQVLGMSPDDVYQAYLKKNQVNHQRQDSGYTAKDEADSKHI
jgi:dimeric dUTPase (all-alpha-NTP-PPase superfamily)